MLSCTQSIENIYIDYYCLSKEDIYIMLQRKRLFRWNGTNNVIQQAISKVRQIMMQNPGILSYFSTNRDSNNDLDTIL